MGEAGALAARVGEASDTGVGVHSALGLAARRGFYEGQVIAALSSLSLLDSSRVNRSSLHNAIQCRS